MNSRSRAFLTPSISASIALLDFSKIPAANSPTEISFFSMTVVSGIGGSD
jgi:hypothetical protein